MSNLGDINAIHILFLAEDVAADDRLNGSYETNLAADPRYYMWQGQQRQMPLGMDGNPEGFAAGLRAALPGVNTLRLTFNDYAFDETGALHPQYERFLAAAAAQGFKLLFTHFDGAQQQLGADGNLDAAKLTGLLNEEVQPRAVAAFEKLLNWLDAHPDVKDQVWGYELANEPAAYERAVTLATRGTKLAVQSDVVGLYAKHMLELGQMVADRDADARILVGGWGYSGRFIELATVQVEGVSALDYLRAAFGPALAWAAHLYPGWHADATVTDAESYAAALDRAYAVLGADDLMITETSLAGHAINDTSLGQTNTVWLSRMQEWFSDRGIGIGWFAGAEAGSSSLVSVDGNGALRYLHQHSLAFALNLISLAEDPQAHRGAEVIHAETRAARLRNESYEDGPSIDAVKQAGFAFGHAGNDTVKGAQAANNFLYGGLGDDSLIGAEAEDFLFGQDGADTLLGEAGADLLFGGRGNDLLIGGAGHDTLEGGAGADRFDARHGSDVIRDFRVAEGDRLLLGHGYSSFAEVRARMHWVASDGGKADDVAIRHADGSVTLLLDAGHSLTAAALDLPETPVTPKPVPNIPPVTEKSVVTTPGGGAEEVPKVQTLAQLLQGLSGADTLKGGAGADRIAGAGGNDLLLGYAGRDRLLGEAGHDTIHGGRDSDWAYGGMGRDRLLGESGNDTLYGGAEADTLFGGDGLDRLIGGSGADLLQGDAGRDYLGGGAGDDRLFGGTAADTLSGDSGRDILFGAGGADILRGGSGDDSLQGGAGNDRLYGEKGDDQLRGGDGTDRLYGGDGKDHIFSGAGRSQLFGGKGDDLLLAQIKADGHVLTGGAGRDSFVFQGADARGRHQSVITDFTLGQDRIVFGTKSLTLQNLPDAMDLREIATGTILTLSPGNSVLLLDVFL